MDFCTVPVPLAEGRAYQVRVGGSVLASLGVAAREIFGATNSCALITDDHVAPLYAEECLSSLRAAGFSPVLITVPAGEPSKSFAIVEDVSRRMIRAGLDRKSFVVALGGGVVGDLAGFAAAIYLRGIPYIQVPTTVLAQVDSSVGGKTGINTPEGKNLIGAFHQPRLVLADTATLASLPLRAWREGFAEIIKHAAIRDAAMFPLIESVLGSPTHDGLDELIARNVAIKSAIVVADECETKGLRSLLNFGHTIGHAIEACAGYGEMLHGEAISIGMRCALHLSERLAGFPPRDSERILKLLRQLELPVNVPDSMSEASILEKLSRDKKFEQSGIKFVLLKASGHAFVSDAVTRQHIQEAIASAR